MVKTVPEYETSQVKTHNGTCAGQNQGFKKKPSQMPEPLLQVFSNWKYRYISNSALYIWWQGFSSRLHTFLLKLQLRSLINKLSVDGTIDPF